MDEQNTRRGAMIVLDWRFIERVLRLPDGMQVVAIQQDALRNAVVLHVRGDMLPVMEPHRYPDEVCLSYEDVRLPDGRYVTIATPMLPPQEGEDTQP